MGLYEHGFVERARQTVPGFQTLPKIAVETGTCLGYSTRRLAELYERVHTVELSPALSRETQNNMSAERYRNVTFHVGDSGELLRAVLRAIDEPALFYLDAHWSGDATTDWQASAWKGYGVSTAHLSFDRAPSADAQVPLLRELITLVGLFPHRAIVYIDDFGQFGADGEGLRDKGFRGEDWSHLSVQKLRAACATRLASWQVDAAGQQLAIFLEPLSPLAPVSP